MRKQEKKRVGHRARVGPPDQYLVQKPNIIDVSVQVEYINSEGQLIKAVTRLNEFIPLTHGRKIDSKHFHLICGDFFERGQLETLYTAGIPTHLPRWVMIIEGEGIGKPDFEFRFVGVRIQNPATCPESRTTHPYIIEIWNDDTNMSMGHLLFGFIWERRVMLRGSRGVLTEIFDPHHRLELDSRTGWAIAQFDLASNKGTPKERANVMRKLAEGYELMTELWESIYKPRGGDTRSKGFTWDNDACLRLRTSYYDVTMPAMNEAEKTIRALIAAKLDNRESICSSCKKYADLDLILALHQGLKGSGKYTASDLALEQAARNIGVNRNDFEISSLRTYLTKGNRLANKR